jgi:hypothetical protein
MSNVTFKLPSGAVNCRSGDYLLQQTGAYVWKVFRVQELIALSRLLPIGGRDATEFLEERHAMDSQKPLGMDEIHVLLTVFAAAFNSEKAAIQAIDVETLGASVSLVCFDIRRFPADNTTIYNRR